MESREAKVKMRIFPAATVCSDVRLRGSGFSLLETLVALAVGVMLAGIVASAAMQVLRGERTAYSAGQGNGLLWTVACEKYLGADEKQMAHAVGDAWELERSRKMLDGTDWEIYRIVPVQRPSMVLQVDFSPGLPAPAP
jgi:prepilin-type N-terminal cleavage/methylation domain-containing protein